ncbi:glutamate receptor ionotropic, delta-1 [Caerostris darwini]|uniref:Glutamate receptor ionotropic, delta-1 n=1 Tax=Caerostris darwini TaxID=1538125 RepID=A0AAV4NMR1_9ARAC|nr:glutamate receptor ionotropic, delta-1 [Caerostris darwini]
MYEHFPKNFEELAEFVKEGEYKVIMPKGTAYMKDTLNSLKESHVFIAETVVRNDWFVTMEDYNNPYIPSKTAVLGSRLAFYFKYGKAPLSTKYISEDTLKFAKNSMMVNKRFCCKKQIDCIIKKINKFGLFKRIINHEIHRSGIRDSKTDSHSECKQRGLSLDDT